MDVEKALRDPANQFAKPADVCEADGIARDEKIRILRRWEYDVRQMNVAEEENMPGNDDAVTLSDVLEALKALGYEPHTEDDPPTKQGGV